MSRRSLLLAAAVAACLAIAAYLSASLGSRPDGAILELDWPWRWLASDGRTLSQVIGQLRVPRVVAGALAGGALAVAGLLLQGVTRNPLADPFLLGVSGGAGLAVVALHAVPGAIDCLGWWAIPAAAFIGAQGATLVVISVARGATGRSAVLGMVLTGVIVNALCGAVTTFLLIGFPPLRLRITTIWLAGGVSYAEWGELAIALVAIVAAICLVRLRAFQLNAFALGEEGAGLVGVESRRVLLESAWTASLLTGVAVSLCGLVGYVGLLVPHVVRRLVGTDFRAALPLTALGGALLLVVGDTASRTMLAPREIPVGVLAAIIGAPVLLLLVRRELGGHA
jgi:iron complex transport system permease protein